MVKTEDNTAFHHTRLHLICKLGVNLLFGTADHMLINTAAESDLMTVFLAQRYDIHITRRLTGIEDIDQAVKSLARENKLIVVTLGSKGSMFYYNGQTGIVPTEKVKPIDTTGAGDAFFGTLLANLEGKEFTKENIQSAMAKANKAGADATQFLGAIKLGFSSTSV